MLARVERQPAKPISFINIQYPVVKPSFKIAVSQKGTYFLYKGDICIPLKTGLKDTYFGFRPYSPEVLQEARDWLASQIRRIEYGTITLK
jgi:hypothetical protein